MNRVAVLGDPAVVRGWGLAGLLVVGASGAEQVRTRWRGLPPEVRLVILTAEAAEALRTEVAASGRMVAILP